MNDAWRNRPEFVLGPLERRLLDVCWIHEGAATITAFLAADRRTLVRIMWRHQ
jgi:hypothetical protein